MNRHLATGPKDRSYGDGIRMVPPSPPQTWPPGSDVTGARGHAAAHVGHDARLRTAKVERTDKTHEARRVENVMGLPGGRRGHIGRPSLGDAPQQWPQDTRGLCAHHGEPGLNGRANPVCDSSHVQGPGGGGGQDGADFLLGYP
jgi:hypothetical protein